jgi:hypothetical protein
VGLTPRPWLGGSSVIGLVVSLMTMSGFVAWPTILMDGFGCVWWVCGELFAATMVFVVFGPLGKLLTLSFYTI